jgi:predicted P-loop ATPase
MTTSFIGYSCRPDVINKPPKEDPIYNGLEKHWVEVRGGAALHCLQRDIKAGKAIAPALYRDGIKMKDHFLQSQLVLLDFDETTDVDFALNSEFFKKHCWGFYTSCNHKDEPGKHRFRLIGITPKVFDSCEEYEGYIAALRDYLVEQGFGEDDSAVNGSLCLFSNDNGRYEFNSFNNRLPDLQPKERTVRDVDFVPADKNSPEYKITFDKVVLCLKHIPPRGAKGTGTFDTARQALMAVVNELGPDGALDAVEAAEWWSYESDFNIEHKVWKFAQEGTHDNPVTIGTLVLLAQKHSQDLEAFNAELSELNRVEIPIDPVALFGKSEGYITPKYETSSALEMPTRDEVDAALNPIQKDPIARQMRIVLDKLLGETNKIRFNELSLAIEVLGKELPPYEFDTVEHWIDEHFGLMGPSSHAQSAIKKVANRNRYHPVKDYLKLVAQDTTDIDLGLVCSRVLGVDDALAKAQVTAWLCGAVAKVMNDEGAPFIEVLTLISPKQGIGKSEFFKSLASPEFFNDSFAQTDNDKDRVLCLHRAWINEISELDQFASKKDLKQLKGLVSTTTDTIRVPYGKTMEQKARRFAIGATANVTGLFAMDDEQRRFWAIEVNPTTECGRLDIDWLRENRDAIWGTAVRLYQRLGDDAFKLTKEQRSQVIHRNAEKFQQVSLLEDRVTLFCDRYDIGSITIDELMEDVCRIPIQSVTQKHKNEVAAILKNEGYERKEYGYKLGVRHRVLWVHPTRKVEYEQGRIVFTVTPAIQPAARAAILEENTDF